MHEFQEANASGSAYVFVELQLYDNHHFATLCERPISPLVIGRTAVYAPNPKTQKDISQKYPYRIMSKQTPCEKKTVPNTPN
jgi:hypothetical protein